MTKVNVLRTDVYWLWGGAIRSLTALRGPRFSDRQLLRIGSRPRCFSRAPSLATCSLRVPLCCWRLTSTNCRLLISCFVVSLILTERSWSAVSACLRFIHLEKDTEHDRTEKLKIYVPCCVQSRSSSRTPGFSTGFLQPEVVCSPGIRCEFLSLLVNRRRFAASAGSWILSKSALRTTSLCQGGQTMGWAGCG